MRREDVEGAVVHIGQQLGRGGIHHGLVAAAHGDPEGLRGAWPQPVPEGGELQIELTIGPRHQHGGALLHELEIVNEREGDPETAAIGHGDGELDHTAATGTDLPSLESVAVTINLEDHLLGLEPGVDEQSCGAAHLHRRALESDQHGQVDRRPALADHHQLLRGFKCRAIVVLGGVEQPVGARCDPRQIDLGSAVVTVAEGPGGNLRPFGPGGHHRPVIVGDVPSRAERIAIAGEVFITRSNRSGQLHRHRRVLRLFELAATAMRRRRRAGCRRDRNGRP